MDDCTMSVEGDRPTDPGNRRSAPRIAVETEISLGSDSQFFTGITGNLSTGGVFVATYRRLPVGSRVTLQLTLPQGEVVARGIVRWLREAAGEVSPGVGIAFEELEPSARSLIDAFCLERDPLYHDDEA
jgi:uncharacterized protein (TIGR02266 family)